MTVPDTKLSSDGAALVAPKLKYIPIDTSSPPHGKCVLINRYQGVAVIGEYRREFGWTHYFPLPTFED